MRLCNFIVRDAITPALAATAPPAPPGGHRDPSAVRSVKEQVIREMVGALHAAGHFRASDVDEIVRAVLRREELGTTGIGRHIAIPHSRHPAADRLIGTLALSRDGLPFDSLDGEPVYVFILLVSPQDRPGDHLRALEAVVRTMRNDDFVSQLRGCQTREEIWALLEGAAPGW
ncbi:PTS sugar transporter subunit IIA [Gemmata sp. JC717]|uniref:PTS sugar transporter subunit IIA n=1 Tax=Gemmata algarum TaxID=2975278 RepID=A0ABU5F2E9_9BACT|nr:PTS sugar transporter subunit IIA [Gemmata algarum]MDY3551706.1 PTS sugar transporter subunit IIA [Gemmata algarum]MDY3561745.1 PTS sugar transporter subunit IIA [Gemmata algarum]